MGAACDRAERPENSVGSLTLKYVSNYNALHEECSPRSRG